MIKEIKSFPLARAQYLVHVENGKEKVYMRLLFDEIHTFEIYLNTAQKQRLQESVRAYAGGGETSHNKQDQN